MLIPGPGKAEHVTHSADKITDSRFDDELLGFERSHTSHDLKQLTVQ